MLVALLAVAEYFDVAFHVFEVKFDQFCDVFFVFDDDDFLHGIRGLSKYHGATLRNYHGEVRFV